MTRTEKKRKESLGKSNNENLENQFKLLRACRLNAIDLINEAEILYRHRCYQRSYTLAYTADEEISKGQIVADYISGVVSKDELVSAFRSHDIKAAYRKITVHIDTTIKTGQLFEHNGRRMEIFTQDNTLTYDLKNAKEMFVNRNRSMYVDFKDDYVTVIPKDNFKAKDAKKVIVDVKKRLDYIFYAEELNGRIGTKALIK